MRLSEFILRSIEPILVDWESMARTMIPPAETLSTAALRDHAAEILIAIAHDMATSQSEAERKSKSEGLGRAAPPTDPASRHGALRHEVGFTLVQLVGEYRALRASVLREWSRSEPGVQEDAIEQVTRFGEAVDQALAASVASYSAKVAGSRDMFLAVLGHDLRNPLGSLSNSIHLLQDATLGEARRQQVTRIATKSIGSMDSMLADLLEYTRTRLGKGVEIRVERGDIARLCAEVADQCGLAYPGRRIELDAPASLVLDFDPSHLRRVLTNLLGNALQHGGVASPVRMACRGDAVEAAITVNNRGNVIREEQMQVIFDPLVQLPMSPLQSHERPATSMGLGLFIAREIVIAHRGTIGVRSSVEDGTTFTIVLPIGAAAPNASVA
jgi:signal transduction histidine kinase